ncbi:DNA methyltransferase [Enterococcus thailandicus]|uniref:DNA methyltransferase n=1 Tax=Enterococcus thailandicus TaxID=417368 RepID=UPI0039A63A0C
MIKTYTKEGDLVLDNCMGSGTTAVAAINTDRKFIGFELNSDYYTQAIQRIKENTTQLSLF